MCVADCDGSAPVRQASRSSQLHNQAHSNYPIYVAGFEILAVVQLRFTILWDMKIPSRGSRIPQLRGNVLSYLSKDDKSLVVEEFIQDLLCHEDDLLNAGKSVTP